MKFPSSLLFILAGSLLSNQVSADSLVTTASENTIVVQSEKLEFTGCNSTQQKIVYEAWSSMLDIAYQVSGRILWNYQASTEYLGGDYGSNQHEDIKAVLNNAYTFKLAWKLNWRAWKINVCCDDWLGSCVKNPAAGSYTTNPGTKMGPKQPPSPALDTINFCNETFFDDTKTCAEAWSMFGHDDDKKMTFRITSVEVGYVVLHELFHLDNLSNKGKQGHIGDLKMAYRPEASWGTNDVGKYVSRNVHSLAQYALAVWVQYKGDSYPNLPARGGNTPERNAEPSLHIDKATNELVLNETALAPYIVGPYISSWDDLAPTCDDVDGLDCLSDPSTIVNITSLSVNNYTDADIAAEAATVQSSPSNWIPAPYTLPDDPYLDCDGGEGLDKSMQAFVPQPLAQTSINEFCTTATVTLSADGASIHCSQIAVDDTTTLGLAAGWQIGDASCNTPRAITTSECELQFGTVLNNCDTDSITQKYGGHRVNNCVAWMISINGTIPDPPTPDERVIIDKE